MTIKFPPDDHMGLMPADFVAHVFGRSSRTVSEWVFRYRLTRFTKDGSLLRGKGRMWLSYREISSKVPPSVLERKGCPAPI
jgi:hypothetical protein